MLLYADLQRLPPMVPQPDGSLLKLPHNERNRFPIIFDASMRDPANTCPRKFYEQYILGLVPRGRSVHLVAGGAYATALEIYREASFDGKDRIEALCDAFVAFVLDWGDYEPPETTTGAAAAKTFSRVWDAVIEYAVQFEYSADHVQPVTDATGRPSVEFSFAVPIPEVLHPDTGEPIIYAGRFDMLAEYRTRQWVYDDKTTGAMGPTWPNQWRLRSQLTGYVWGAQQFGYNVHGAIVRGMCIQKTQFKTKELYLLRTKTVVDAWYSRLIWDLERLKYFYENNIWPQQGQESGGCSDYGGCAYLDICESANPQRARDTLLEPYRWNPVTREDDDKEAANAS